MPLLIDRKPVTDDSWRRVDEETEQLPQGGDLIVPLARLNQHPDWFEQRQVRIAPLVRGDDDLTALLERLDQLPMIAVEFPVFRDGAVFPSPASCVGPATRASCARSARWPGISWAIWNAAASTPLSLKVIPRMPCAPLERSACTTRAVPMIPVPSICRTEEA